VRCRVLEHSLVKHLLVAEHDGTELRATVMLDHGLAVGTEVDLGFPAPRRLYFDREGRRLRPDSGAHTAFTSEAA
jgi:hypothetical protein